MPSFKQQYDSFDAFVARVADETVPTWEGYRSSIEEPDEWSGNVTVEESIQLASYGWRKGREQMSNELDMAHNSTSFERLPTYEYDVAGYMPNIPLYVAGCPSHMMSPLGNESAMGKVVDIKINISASSNNSSRRLMRRGASILSLIDKLEDSGLSCNVNVCEYTRASQGKGFFLIEFPIKKAGQPMDIDRCAYALVHPSMLRKLCFVACEQELKAKSGWQSGYGRPMNLPIHERQGCVYFPEVGDMIEDDMESQMARTIEIYENQTSGKDWDGSEL